MRRRVIRLGSSTLVLSLPSKWVKEHGVKAGTELDVEEDGKALRIGSRTRAERKAAVKLTDESREDLRNLLTHLYRVGVETIVLHGVTPTRFSVIRTVVQDLLMGFEVTERTETGCTVASISTPSEEQYDALLRRTFLIIKETGKLVQEELKAGTYQRRAEIDAARAQQDKIILFCRRILNKERDQDMAIRWELLTFLMHIHHAYYYLYQYAADRKVKGSKQAISLLSSLQEYFEIYYKAAYGQDVAQVHRLNALKSEFQFGKCYDAIERSTGKDAVVLSHIREIFRLVQVGSSPIFSGALGAQAR